MFTRKRSGFLVAAAAISALSAVPAFAADLGPAPDPVFTPVSAFSWTGFYAGFHAGYGWGEFPTNADARAAAVLGNPAIAFTDDLGDAEGIFGGAQVGYNYQYGSFVIGAEAELALSGIEDDLNIAGAVPGEAQLNFFGTVALRAGYSPIDRTLVYLKGGYAFGEAEVDANLIAVAPPVANVSDSNIHHGYVLGAGVEYAFTDNASLKLEYNYISLGEETFNLGPVTDVDAEFEGHTIKTGLNFLF